MMPTREKLKAAIFVSVALLAALSLVFWCLVSSTPPSEDQQRADYMELEAIDR